MNLIVVTCSVKFSHIIAATGKRSSIESSVMICPAGWCTSAPGCPGQRQRGLSPNIRPAKRDKENKNQGKSCKQIFHSLSNFMHLQVSDLQSVCLFDNRIAYHSRWCRGICFQPHASQQLLRRENPLKDRPCVVFLTMGYKLQMDFQMGQACYFRPNEMNGESTSVDAKVQIKGWCYQISRVIILLSYLLFCIKSCPRLLIHDPFHQICRVNKQPCQAIPETGILLRQNRTAGCVPDLFHWVS